MQRMASGGVEMFVGGLQDPTFGPVVLCGSGGVLIEFFGDVACRLCPLTERDAEECWRRSGCRAAARLSRPAAGRRISFRDALMRVAALIAACPEIQELDINPLNVIDLGGCGAGRAHSCRAASRTIDGTARALLRRHAAPSGSIHRLRPPRSRATLVARRAYPRRARAARRARALLFGTTRGTSIDPMRGPRAVVECNPTTIAPTWRSRATFAISAAGSPSDRINCRPA